MLGGNMTLKIFCHQERLALKCGHDHFRKESDIMDVWFDSGSSHAVVLEQREELAWPNGHVLGRKLISIAVGSSLPYSLVATRGRAPYKAVLTRMACCGTAQGRK